MQWQESELVMRKLVQPYYNINSQTLIPEG